jgi:hypothetical protein
MRTGKFEIFKNPSNKEIQDFVKSGIRDLRFIINDQDRKTWYLFDSHLLHQRAMENLLEDGEVENGYYRSGEVSIFPDNIKIYLYHGVYKVGNGKISFTSTNYDRKWYDWLPERLKFLNCLYIRYDGQLVEEYFSRGRINSHIHEYRSFEIFKNPSRKEYLEALNDSRYKSIRLLIDKKNNDIYVATGDCLHDEIAKEINSQHQMDYPSYYYPLIGEINKNILTIRPSSVAKISKAQMEKIKVLMKEKTSFDLRWENN